MWRSHFSLKDFHTFRVETFADIFFVPKSQNQACQILKKAYEASVPVFILGSGTNLLLRDGGLRGLVLYQGPRYNPEKVRVLFENHDSMDLQVSSRFSKAELLRFAVSKKLTGLEFSAGIPGTLGGAVWMNAGTKWGSYSEVIEEVTTYHPQKGFEVIPREKMGFAYRSHSKSVLDEWTLIHSVKVRLKKLQSKEAQKESLKKIDDILLYRGTRQPLELPNCGSVFKNPDNSEKGAGRLIEAAQLKGSRQGGACISLQHANFFHNSGNARSRDIESLIQKTKLKIQEKFGVDLEPEVIILGDRN